MIRYNVRHKVHNTYRLANHAATRAEAEEELAKLEVNAPGQYEVLELSPKDQAAELVTLIGQLEYIGSPVWGVQITGILSKVVLVLGDLVEESENPHYL